MWNVSLSSINDESKYTSNNNVIKIKIYFWERKLTKLIVLLSNNQTNISLKQNTILILLAFPDNNFREFIDSLLVQN